MTADSYLSLFLILMSFTVICLLHGEKLYNNLLLILFQIFSLVSTFCPSLTVMLQYVHHWHKKTLFIKQEWSSTVTE